MKKYTLKVLSMIIILLVCFSGSVGCQSKQPKPVPKEPGEDKPPQAVEELETLSEDLLKSVSKKEWSESTDQIKSIHSQWNKFFAAGQKAGLPPEVAKSFTQDLNTLTTLVVNKAMEESKKEIELEHEKTEVQLQIQMDQGKNSGDDAGGQEPSPPKLPKEVLPDHYPVLTSSLSELQVSEAVVELTKHIPSFIGLYKSELPPEVLKSKYYIRSIKISAKQKNWEKASIQLNKLKETWTGLQPKIIKKKEDMAVQFNQSIVELEEVTMQKNPTLATVKSDIALENIHAMSKLYE